MTFITNRFYRQALQEIKDQKAAQAALKAQLLQLSSKPKQATIELPINWRSYR